MLNSRRWLMQPDMTMAKVSGTGRNFVYRTSKLEEIEVRGGTNVIDHGHYVVQEIGNRYSDTSSFNHGFWNQT